MGGVRVVQRLQAHLQQLLNLIGRWGELLFSLEYFCEVAGFCCWLEWGRDE